MPMNNLTKKVINARYKIEDIVGVGGMAVVYKALDLKTGETVAVKVLKQEFLQDAQFRKRFETESKIIEMLSHENIVKIFNVGFNDDLYYIVMEYIDGITLKQYIEQQGQLKWQDALYFISQVLRALDHAHKRGIIHRDIKPQNIMLLSDGSIKVTDLGIAKMSRVATQTMTDKAIGSVHYISPEQVSGGKADERSDIYSTGIMLYEMITGKVPFDAENPVSVALMQLQKSAQKPKSIVTQLPAGLEEIVLRAIAKRPEDRYPSAEEFLNDIEKFKKNPDIIFGYKPFSDERPTGLVDVVKDSNEKKKRKSASGAIAGIFAALLLIAAGTVFFILSGIGNASEETDIKVPDLTGKTLEQIEKDELYKDFKVRKVTEAYNSSYGAGQVYRQDPLPDITVKKGSEIRVYISLGEETVTLPAVKNLNYLQAQINLNRLGLKPEVEREYSDSVILDYVIRSEPAEGEKVAPGSVVKLYVSLGKAPVTVEVPDFTGMTKAEAQKKIAELGLIASYAVVESKAEEGRVVWQSIESGSEVSGGAIIYIQISDGSLAPKKKYITINLPDSPPYFTVRVVQSGVEVYNSVHVPEERFLLLELLGEGIQPVEVYINDVLHEFLTVQF